MYMNDYFTNLSEVLMRAEMETAPDPSNFKVVETIINTEHKNFNYIKIALEINKPALHREESILARKTYWEAATIVLNRVASNFPKCTAALGEEKCSRLLESLKGLVERSNKYFPTTEKERSGKYGMEFLINVKMNDETIEMRVEPSFFIDDIHIGCTPSTVKI